MFNLIVKKESNEEMYNKSSESNIISSSIYQNDEEVNNEDLEKETKKDSDNNMDNDIKSSEKENPNNDTSSESKDDNKVDPNANHQNNENQSIHDKTNNTGNEASHNISENVSELENKTKSQSKIVQTKHNDEFDEKVHHHSMNIKHTSCIEKDTSEEFYKGICGNYYRYESDESSESIYSELDLLPNMEKPNRGRHRKHISMSYPSVSEGQSTISIDRTSNEQALYFSKEGPIEEEQKEFDQNSPNININNSNDSPECGNGNFKEEGSIHSQFLQVDKKAMLRKEYSSDGDVTDHDNLKSNVTNNAFSDREIKELAIEKDVPNENIQKQNKNLYHQLIKNVKEGHKQEEFSEDSIVNIGIHGSNDLSKSSKTEITNLVIKKDVSEKVDITDICEDKDSLKTASIEDCTSQMNLEEEEIDVDKYDEKAVNIVINKPDDELNHRFDEDLDCILEERCDSNNNEKKGHITSDCNNFNDESYAQLINNSNIKGNSIYLQNNVSVPDDLNLKTDSTERRGHEKTNSYCCNDFHNTKYLHPLNDIATSNNSGFSTISGSVSYSGNLFGTYRSDNSDKFSDKVNKYYSLKSESKNNSKSNSLKIRNSSRDIYASFKKPDSKYRLDKSLNGSISKRSKKPMNIQFMAKYLKDDGNGNGEEEDLNLDGDISSRLTAKEFAKLVGINILYDDDEKEEIANLKKEGINKLSPNTHQPIDLSMFVPPNQNELATLHHTMPKSAPSNPLPNDNISIDSFKEDMNSKNIFGSHGKILSDEIDHPKETHTAPSTRTKFEFIINSSKPLHTTSINPSVHHLTSETADSSTKAVSANQPAQTRTEKEVTIKTQSTVSAKGRTFEVSYSSNTEFPEKNKPSTLGSQGSKVRNSKTEPNIHNEYSRPISRNSSIDNSKITNIKSSSSLRSNIPSVSIVHGGPSEEMCRCILEKANPILKIERETRNIIDSPMTDIDNDNYTIERIKLGETQTRPIAHSSLQTVQTPSDGRKASPIITAALPNRVASSNASTDINASDSKVITFNKPLLSNNSKVIFFKSKRNNYINLQSTNLDGNKHRQLHKRRFEIRSSPTDGKFNKTLQEESEDDSNEINNKEKLNDDLSESSIKKNSIFYSSTSPTIKNLRTFSFTSNHHNSSSSINSPHTPSKPFIINTDHILSPFTPLSPDPIEEDNEYDDVDSHHSVSSHTLISGNNNLSGLQSPTLQYLPSKPLIPSQSPLSHNLQSQETSHTLILPGNLSNGELKVSSNSVTDNSQPLSKSYIISASSSLATPSSTGGNTHTVITMSSPNNNQTVITTTKTTTTNHTFITTKTTNVPISSLLIDTNNVNPTPSLSSPNTTAAINSANYTRDEMINMAIHKMNNTSNSINNSNSNINNDITNNNTTISNNHIYSNINISNNNNDNNNNNNNNNGSYATNFTNDTTSTTFINSVHSAESSTSVSKHNSYNEKGMIRIPSSGENVSFYKCSKNLSSYDVPNNNTSVTTLKAKASSVTNSKFHDPFYNRKSNSSIDMNISYELAQKSFDTTSSVNRPLMVSTPNSVKVSNVEMLQGSEITTHSNISNDMIPPPLNISNNTASISNTSYTTSPVSEASHSLFCESPTPLSVSYNSNSGITTSPSLTVMPTQQSGSTMLSRHPKSLYIPRSCLHKVKNTSSGNISISSVLTTTEETKGRFQIEKSEERKIATVSTFNGSGGNISIDSFSPTKCSEKCENDDVFQMKSNSYCNDDRGLDSPLSSVNSNSGNLTMLSTPRRFSTNVYKGELEQNYISTPLSNRITNINSLKEEKHPLVNNKLNHVQTMVISSCDNILRKISISDRNKQLSNQKDGVNCSSCNSVNNIEKGIKENEIKDNNNILGDSISNDFLKFEVNDSNGDISNSNSSSPKKKEIVKGRFTIIRDS